jgi:Pyruvate/2-oxoacid:ferredoxin oxidoreductase delta subunit
VDQVSRLALGYVVEDPGAMTMIEFLSSDFVKLSLPLLAAVVAWIFNERSKRAQEEYNRKEVNYKALIASLRGFYAATHDTDVKRAFLDRLNECWLYCPDEVIKKANSFLETIKVGSNHPDNVKELACGELIAAIRRDMLSRRVVARTELEGDDFKHFGAT